MGQAIYQLVVMEFIFTLGLSLLGEFVRNQLFRYCVLWAECGNKIVAALPCCCCALNFQQRNNQTNIYENVVFGRLNSGPS